MRGGRRRKEHAGYKDDGAGLFIKEDNDGVGKRGRSRRKEEEEG